MSSNARKAEKARGREEEQARQDEERSRVNNLTLDDRIDECDADNSVKEILRIMADKAGIRWDVP